MPVKWTQASRKHRIGRARARYVMGTATPTADVPGASGQPRLRWEGPDDRGILLEVIAVITAADTLLVIHVMPIDLRRAR